VSPVTDLAELRVDPATALVYEHGWQSWSPTAAYRLAERPYRPTTDGRRVMCYRPDRSAPADAFWGEGLLAVDPGDGSGVHVFAAAPGGDAVPSIRAVARGDRVTVAADGPVGHDVDGGPGGVEGALGRWADRYAASCGVTALRPAPTVWCSWYHYFTEVTEGDVDDNLDAMDELGLDVEVVQIDDGYQREIGDWLEWSDRFRSLAHVVARMIRDRGRRAGIWVAPFLVGSGSETARHHWGQDLAALDVTHPGADAHLREVFGTLRAMGVDYFKIDFVYAGALDGRRHDPAVPGVEAYRRGLRSIRAAIGPDAYLLGCGAPILPSVGLVDAMRVSPDTAPAYEPVGGDMSQPAQRSAVLTGRWRAFQHGRFWVNDPDCLLARPAVERRADWAAHVERYGGLRASSDRLRDLDAWGLATTRRLLRRVPATPFA
jgi:alpha-galactosidase